MTTSSGVNLARFCDTCHMLAWGPQTVAQLMEANRQSKTTVLSHLKALAAVGLVYRCGKVPRESGQQGADTWLWAWQPTPFFHPDAKLAESADGTKPRDFSGLQLKNGENHPQ